MSPLVKAFKEGKEREIERGREDGVSEREKWGGGGKRDREVGGGAVEKETRGGGGAGGLKEKAASEERVSQ